MSPYNALSRALLGPDPTTSSPAEESAWARLVEAVGQEARARERLDVAARLDALGLHDEAGRVLAVVQWQR
jgi:hypothetical protein